MADAEEVEELIFFDTFSHEFNQDLNLDLVQFRKPVYITEVRIIPLGARVQADFPGGVRLGATNPHQFHIDFFLNNLLKQGAPTFEFLGDFEYNQNDCINMEFLYKENNNRPIPTDGLVLRGWYETITLAVYGKITNGITEPVAVPPEPAPPISTTQTVSVQITTGTTTAGADGQPIPAEDQIEWQSAAEQAVAAVAPAPPTPAPVPTAAARKEAYTAAYPAEPFDGGAAESQYGQQSQYFDANQKELRYKKAERAESSGSDWDRDEREETAAAAAASAVTKAAPAPPPPRRQDASPDPREIVRTRESNSRAYSKSSSRERDYHIRKRDWSRSPEYRSSRHRTLSYEQRSKRDKSRDHERRTPPDSADVKRPRTPPILSPPRRAPRTPERSPTTSATSNESKAKSDHHKKRTSEYEKSSTVQPIRVIDHSAIEDRSSSTAVTVAAAVPTSPPPPSASAVPSDIGQVESPSPALAVEPIDDEVASQGEPFEPILSDEEIGDESEAQYDMDFDFTDVEDVTRPFNPATAIYERFIKDFDEEKELETACKILQKIKMRDNLESKRDFELLSPDGKENWVHSVEHFIQVLNIIHNFNYAKRNTILSNLVAENTDNIVLLIKIGLDFDCAMQQTQPGFKLRHIKIGARLSELLGCCSDLMAVLLFRDKFDIFSELFYLYNQNYMALSIKLLIIKALYSTLDTKVSMDYFLTEQTFGNESTVYQKIIKALQDNPLTRVKFALRSLMKKVNLYESLQLIREIVTKFFIMDNYENRSTDLQLLKVTLDEVYKAYTWDEISYTQPKRFLPVAAKYEIVKDVAAVKCTGSSFQSYFSTHAFLETLLLLISNRPLLPPNIIGLCFDLLAALVKSSSGLDYIYNNIDTTSVLIKCLLQANSFYEDEAMAMEDVVDPAEAAATAGPPVDVSSRSYKLGIEIAYKIKSKFYLDALQNTPYSFDDIADLLHLLYSLAATSNAGKIYVANMVATDNNICILLSLIDKERKAEQLLAATAASSLPPGDKLKSPIIGYCVDLIDITIRHCSRMTYLEEHGSAILSLCKNHAAYDSTISLILEELCIYLKPLEIPGIFRYDNIAPLCELIKRSIDFITTFPGDLITALRIISHFAIDIDEEAEEQDADAQQHVELRYKFVVLQFYSADGIVTLNSILDKLNAFFEQPGLHSSLLATNQGLLTTQIVLPVVQVLRKMLSYVIQCRNTQYKDLTVVDHILRTYTLMESIPAHAIAAENAQLIKAECIKTLLCFTQPTPAEGVDTESVHKSLWTQMIGELLKYTLNGPCTYLSGLLIFSELLPVPLPIYTMQPLFETEVSRLVTERQLWSAHLHPKSAALTEMIQTICSSSYGPLLAALNRTCVQLADLAPNMSVVIAKACVDLILEEESAATVTSAGSTAAAAAATARLLSFLSNLIRYGSIKVAFKSMILPGKCLDYLIGQLLETGATGAAATTPAVALRTKEHILQIMQILLDNEIGIGGGGAESRTSSNDDTSSTRLQWLANALPPKENIGEIVVAMVENFLIAFEQDRLVPQSVAALKVLTKYDYTLYLLHTALDKQKTRLLSVLDKLATKYKESIATQQDATILQSFLDFLQSLIRTSDGGGSEYRTIALSAFEFATMVSWPSAAAAAASVVKDSDAGDANGAAVAEEPKPLPPHALLQLQAVVESSADLKECNDTLKFITTYLETAAVGVNGEAAATAASEMVEPAWPTCDGIVAQYNARPIYSMIDDYDEDVHSNYWRGGADDDVEMDESNFEQIPCDLTDIIKTCLPADVNVTSECKRLLHLSASPQSNRERTTTAPCFRTRRVEVEPTTGRPEKKIYVTRGRGFPRTPPTRGDLFRSRPPNTSRPPSLHVDDFLALETCGAQPTGPTGYNKLSRDIISIRGSRGRGGRGGFSDRGGRGSGSSSSGVYRQNNRRTQSPSTWQSHGNVDAGGGGGGGGGGAPQQHYRTATSEPVVGPSHFSNQSSGDYSSGGHFSTVQTRGRMRGLSRPPRTFTR